MKIYLHKEWQEVEYLNFIASYRYINDLNSWIFVSESLFQLPDGLYIVRIDYKLGPILGKAKVGKKIFNHKIRPEPNPKLWLLTHGHERLASYMFPELASNIKIDCAFYEKEFRRYRGETIYGAGEAKGETFHGKFPF
jgi:hypothetical protein